MIEVTAQGQVIYKTGDNRLGRFPEAASQDLLAGPKRNFQVFDPLDFLAEVTQHIPDPGEHLIRYYGFYSNKSRGLRTQGQAQAAPAAAPNSASAPSAPSRPESVGQGSADQTGLRGGPIALSQVLGGDEGHRLHRAAYHIIAGKGATYYGIGSAVARIVDVLLHNRRAILSICCRITGVPDCEGVTLALPHLVGGDGRWPRFRCRWTRANEQDFLVALAFCARLWNL
jgi:hypothetical protein